MEKVIMAGLVETARFRVLMYDKIKKRIIIEVFESRNPTLNGYRFFIPLIEEDFEHPGKLTDVIRDRAERILMSRLSSTFKLPKEGTIF